MIDLLNILAYFPPNDYLLLKENVASKCIPSHIHKHQNLRNWRKWLPSRAERLSQDDEFLSSLHFHANWHLDRLFSNQRVKVSEYAVHSADWQIILRFSKPKWNPTHQVNFEEDEHVHTSSRVSSTCFSRSWRSSASKSVSTIISLVVNCSKGGACRKQGGDHDLVSLNLCSLRY